ncbi:MAG: ribonuclease P protein component [Burkholderiales bacterium]|nr:ribonuclease P protein component [Burkholderiales bacterium]
MQHLAGTAQSLPTQVADIAFSEKGRGKGKRFCRHHRLIQREVVDLLKDGARINRAEFFVRLGENKLGYARMAVAVPKRILKLAVDRNRVKRLIREEFRQSKVRAIPADLLVTLRSAVTVGPKGRKVLKQQRLQLQRTLTQLLGDIARRFGAAA